MTDNPSGRMSDFDMLERLDAASRDDRLADGMLYRQAAERIAEYMGRDVSYWHRIMSRTDKQAERITELEAALNEVKEWAHELRDQLSYHQCGDGCGGCVVCMIPDAACDSPSETADKYAQEDE